MIQHVWLYHTLSTIIPDHSQSIPHCPEHLIPRLGRSCCTLRVSESLADWISSSQGWEPSSFELSYGNDMEWWDDVGLRLQLTAVQIEKHGSSWLFWIYILLQWALWPIFSGIPTYTLQQLANSLHQLGANESYWGLAFFWLVASLPFTFSRACSSALPQ